MEPGTSIHAIVAPTDESRIVDLLKTDYRDALALSEKEQLLLDLWDQEEEARLENALLHAELSSNTSDLHDLSNDEVNKQLRLAERELLDSRASYLLRNKIIDDVLIVDPVLKAVHSGSNANAIERRLAPLINERDILSMTHSTLATRLAFVGDQLTTLEQKNAAANDKNKELAHMLLQLAGDLKAQGAEEVQDPQLREHLEEAEEQVRVLRRRWRTTKSLVSGVVVGSGVEWAQNDQWRELVMDDEDELG